MARIRNSNSSPASDRSKTDGCSSGSESDTKIDKDSDVEIINSDNEHGKEKGCADQHDENEKNSSSDENEAEVLTAEIQDLQEQRRRMEDDIRSMQQSTEYNRYEQNSDDDFLMMI